MLTFVIFCTAYSYLGFTIKNPGIYAMVQDWILIVAALPMAVLPMAFLGILFMAMLADLAQSDTNVTGSNKEGSYSS